MTKPEAEAALRSATEQAVRAGIPVREAVNLLAEGVFDAGHIAWAEQVDRLANSLPQYIDARDGAY